MEALRRYLLYCVWRVEEWREKRKTWTEEVERCLVDEYRQRATAIGEPVAPIRVGLFDKALTWIKRALIGGKRWKH